MRPKRGLSITPFHTSTRANNRRTYRPHTTRSLFYVRPRRHPVAAVRPQHLVSPQQLLPPSISQSTTRPPVAQAGSDLSATLAPLGDIIVEQMVTRFSELSTSRGDGRGETIQKETMAGSIQTSHSKQMSEIFVKKNNREVRKISNM